jgi:hypothetical protein
MVVVFFLCWCRMPEMPRVLLEKIDQANHISGYPDERLSPRSFPSLARGCFELLKLRVFGLGLFEDGKVGVLP